MSRRKQSNPKPLKSGDCPDENSDPVLDVLHSTKPQEEDNSGDSNESSSDMCPDLTVSETKPHPKGETISDNGEADELKENRRIKQEPESDSNADDADVDSASMHQLMKHLQLPNDVLFLKKIKVSMHGNTAVCWVVCCAIPLPKGSSLGPFQGEIILAEKVKVGDMILQFSSRKNQSILVNVTEQSGAWLALLRPGSDTVPRNTEIHLEGDRLWCEIVADLDVGNELIASFSYHPEDSSQSCTHSPEPCIPKEPEPSKADVSVTTAKCSRSPVNHAALIYGCPFCGVRFSSPRTLQGHLAYYCSRKPTDQGMYDNPDGDESQKNISESGKVSGKTEVKQEKQSDNDGNDKEDKSRPVTPKRHLAVGKHSDSPPAKCLKSEPHFQCESCSYSADKISSLNRHRRIHNRTGDDDSNNKSDTDSSPDKFCSYCNIQFSSLSTYNCHKEFYCSKNKLCEKSDSVSGCDRVENLPPAISQQQLLTRMILPSEQLISQPTSTTVIGQTTVIFAAPIMAPNGLANLGITMPTVIVQPIVAPAQNAPATETKHRSVTPMEAHQKETTMAEKCLEKPLDLSRRKDENVSKSVLCSVSAKTPSGEQASISSHENHHLLKEEKAEHLPPNPTNESPTKDMFTGSSSPTSPHSVAIPSKISTPFMMSPFGSLPISGTSCQALTPLPKTVSKCLDCSIVFYKHENYLIHKEHYCSGKKNWAASPHNTEDSSSNDTSVHASPDQDFIKQDPDSLTSTSSKVNKELGHSFSDDEVTYKFFCIPCKIKFSSASTLKAHKEFYCPHGKDSGHTVIALASSVEEGSDKKENETNEFQCNQCDSVFSTARLLKLHICSGKSSQMPLLKCPYCDYITQTDTRLSDHLKVHAPTRTFRCTLCGYRGNTVRGMRMHGKIHIDAGEEFTDDNMVVFEEPPLIPVTTNEQLSKGPINMEAELIRLKNEPYKRRRSKKSYEKSENIISPGLSQHCHVCGDMFDNIKFLNMHMKIHEIASRYQHELMNCNQCEYSATSDDDLVSHKKHMHTKTTVETNERKLPAPLELVKKPISTSESPVEKNSTSDLPVIVKDEPNDAEFDKIDQTSKNEIIQDSKENIVKIEPFTNGLPSSISPKNDSSSSRQNGSNPSPANGIGSGLDDDGSNKHCSSHSRLLQPGAVFPYLIIPSSSVSSLHENASKTASSNDRHGQKYCKNCDISFTYLSTFIAHKKYYCTSKASETEASSTTVS